MRTKTIILVLLVLVASSSGCKKNSKAKVTVTAMRYTNFSARTGPLIPADGATVRYYVNGGSSVVDTKTAGSDGKATFENLDPDTYNFNAFQTINASSRNGDADVIISGSDNKSISITLD